MPLNAPIGYWKKGSKGKLAKTIFHFLNADASRSKCSFKSEKARSKFEDGDGTQAPFQLKNRQNTRTTFKMLKVFGIL